MRDRRILYATGALALAAISAAPAVAHAAASPALTVDAGASRKPISPDIYGINRPAAALADATALPVDRMGGNTTTRFNYTNNTWNTGSDYFYENIAGGSSASIAAYVGPALKRRTKPIVTVPVLGWVSKTSPAAHPFTCSYPRSSFPAQDSFDPWDAACGNGQSGGAAVAGALPETTSVPADAAFVRAEVAHYVAQFGTAARGGVPIWQLDNEPALWNSTHRDVHPAPVTYDELRAKSLAVAGAVKDADPTALVLGPSDWGWCAYFYSPADSGGCGPGSDRTSHANLEMAAYYLKSFANSAAANGGRRLLDYFDEHYYPQGNGVALAPVGSAATQALRLRSVRSLWDPSYRDESWIGAAGQVNAPPIQMIPRMKKWVAAYYPGTKTAITEYNFGALDAMNGALTQADVLGVFGREGLDLATLWASPAPGDPGAYAFRMFRNYDGRGARFGETSIAAASTDQGRLSVYAAQRARDGALTIVVINKSGTPISAPLAVRRFAGSGVVQRWSYGAARPGAITRGADLAVRAGAVGATYPASSITVLVLPAKV